MSNMSSNVWKQHGANGTSGYTRQDNTEYLTSDPINSYETDLGNYYDDYSYFNSEVHAEFLRNIHRHTSVFAAFLSVWTFVINILIILACMGSRNVRHNGYYIQIVNLSVSNMMIGGFVIPLTIYYIQHSWDLGQALCKIYVIADVLLPFTSVLIIIVLNVDRIMSIIHPRLYAWIFQKSLKSVIICVPWFTALVVVIPIWTSGTIPYENGPGECIVLISKESAILCPLMTYFIPVITLITLTFKLLLLKMQTTASTSESVDNTRLSMRTYKTQHNDTDVENSEFIERSSTLQSNSTSNVKDKRDDIVALCAVNTSFAIMWFPFQCISFFLSFCHSQSCIPSIGLNQVVTWVGTSSAGIVPIFWFLDLQLRKSLRNKCVRPPQVDMHESSNSEETFL